MSENTSTDLRSDVITPVASAQAAKKLTIHTPNGMSITIPKKICYAVSNGRHGEINIVVHEDYERMHNYRIGNLYCRGDIHFVLKQIVAAFDCKCQTLVTDSDDLVAVIYHGNYFRRYGNRVHWDSCRGLGATAAREFYTADANLLTVDNAKSLIKNVYNYIETEEDRPKKRHKV